MSVELYSGTVVSIPFDHHKIDARFYHIVSHEKHLEEKPVILRLHGTLGNLLDESEHFLPGVLARGGYSSLTMNTLLANLGLFFGFGIFDDTMQQIDAACDFLRQVGFKKIVIAGHGLGGCMAIRYGALRNDPAKYPDIVGVVAIATPHSMPDMTRRRWEEFGSEPTYEEVYHKAKHVFCTPLDKEPAKDEIVVIKKAHGKTRLPEHTEVYTLKTWWALAGPETEGPKAYKNIDRINVPILIVQGLQDEFVRRHESESLGRIARDAGNKDVTQVFLDACHTFDGRHHELAQVMIKWLNERFEEK
ncbi:alpha/beta fold hydrolase [Candidatus Omnitrophota bacterium]